jgi:hypothetical protein
MSGLEVFQFLNSFDQLLGKGEDLLGVGQYRVPRLGDSQTARPAVEEGDAQKLLQLLDLDRHCWLGDFHGFRGAGETQVTRDHLEDIKLVEIQLPGDGTAGGGASGLVGHGY